MVRSVYQTENTNKEIKEDVWAGSQVALKLVILLPWRTEITGVYHAHWAAVPSTKAFFPGEGKGAHKTEEIIYVICINYKAQEIPKTYRIHKIDRV